MRPPEFWNHREGRDAAIFLRTMLAPIGWVYAHASAYRLRTTKPLDVGVPVICVGNATLGGTGKTPLAKYLLQSFSRLTKGAVVLSKGYGGKEKGPLIVKSQHSALDVGDEPKMLANAGRVWIAAGRDEGARAAVANGAKIIIMDDGHQNPHVFKDLNLLVVDGETGFGNGYVFPAGPLREPAKTALGRADAVVLMLPYAGYHPDEDLMDALAPLPVIRAYLKPADDVPEGKLFAFAGIGRPNKFFDSLRRAGGDVVDGIGFADHHKYTLEDLKSLSERAKEYGARLITTEKDFVRIPAQFKTNITPWPVDIAFEDELSLRQILHSFVETLRKAP